MFWKATDRAYRLGAREIRSLALYTSQNSFLKNVSYRTPYAVPRSPRGRSPRRVSRALPPRAAPRTPRRSAPRSPPAAPLCSRVARTFSSRVARQFRVRSLGFDSRSRRISGTLFERKKQTDQRARGGPGGGKWPRTRTSSNDNSRSELWASSSSSRGRHHELRFATLGRFAVSCRRRPRRARPRSNACPQRQVISRGQSDLDTLSREWKRLAR